MREQGERALARVRQVLAGLGDAESCSSLVQQLVEEEEARYEVEEEARLEMAMSESILAEPGALLADVKMVAVNALAAAFDGGSGGRRGGGA